MILYLILSLWLPDSKVIDSEAVYYSAESFCEGWAKATKAPPTRFSNGIHGYQIDFEKKTVTEVTCEVTPTKLVEVK